MRSFYGGATPLFFFASRLVTGVEGGVAGSMVEGGRSAGQSGDIGEAGVIGAEAFEEVLVELESATGTRQGDLLRGVLLHWVISKRCELRLRHFRTVLSHLLMMIRTLWDLLHGWLRHLFILLCS